ncbi:hypothetical protein BFW01_g912 [Lasiodiplodia theobromae]|uniref:Uncharacterized protein n=1 Tax=Lasiodiplodia theobromae TaxID=45133 RepID=A0A8H7MAP3_9PEZI|nr:hypothetical protein BFW01_g912 [Lasiodiplodia theobromae]
MHDDELDRMPLAAIPTTSPGQSSANDTTNLFVPVPSFSQQQTPPSASPVLKPEYQQTSTLDLTDDQLGALLLANCTTPPPFETINPSTLSSPGPVTDFSGSDCGLASAASSPFYPFNDDIGSTSISCPPTPGLQSLPAPVARRYSRIHNMHDEAFTELDASPEGFPLVGQPSGSSEQIPHGLPTSSPQHVRQGHQHTYSHPQALIPAQSQSPQPVGSLNYQHAPFPTPPPSNQHPYPPALQQQALQQSPGPTQGEVTFHRQTGHYLGPPRIRHPYPPGAHIAPNAQDYQLLDQQRQQQQQQIQHMQNAQQHRQLLIQQQQQHLRQLQQQHIQHQQQPHHPHQHQHSNPNIGLLTRGSVPIGTPITPPPCSPTASTPSPRPSPPLPPRVDDNPSSSSINNRIQPNAAAALSTGFQPCRPIQPRRSSPLAAPAPAPAPSNAIHQTPQQHRAQQPCHSLRREQQGRQQTSAVPVARPDAGGGAAGCFCARCHCSYIIPSVFFFAVPAVVGAGGGEGSGGDDDGGEEEGRGGCEVVWGADVGAEAGGGGVGFGVGGGDGCGW